MRALTLVSRTVFRAGRSMPGAILGLVVLAVRLAAEPVAATTLPAGFSPGADLRVRNEYFDNALTLNSDAVRHEQNYQRCRARVWGTAAATPRIDATVRLTWESWNWNRNSYKAPFHRGWATSEGIFDLLNVRWKDPGNLPVEVTVGRQELRMGDGWLIAEGTPLDGSRTTFFDAVRATIRCRARTTIDCTYIDQSARNCGRLGTLNHQDIALAEQDERSGFVYLANRSLAGTQLDAYIIHRSLTRVLPGGDNGAFSVFGTRVTTAPSASWLLKAETACETGTKNGRRLRAWGFLTQAAWTGTDATKPQLRLTAEGLSGDRRGSARDGQFDIAWGRYPRWSEIMALVTAPETRPGQLGNLLRTGPGWSISPTGKIEVSVDYNAIWALQNNRDPAGGWFGTGRFRGHLFRSVVTFRVSRRWQATLLGEVFAPGGYYGTKRRDTASFFRTELVHTF